jgi:hypothetical protein
VIKVLYYYDYNSSEPKEYRHENATRVSISQDGDLSVHIDDSNSPVAGFGRQFWIKYEITK